MVVWIPHQGSGEGSQTPLRATIIYLLLKIVRVLNVTDEC